MEAGGSIQEAKKQGGAGSDQDLSMEEILQSIRRIIAEDDSEKKADKTAQPASEDSVPGSDVLELTEMLKEDGSVINVKDDAKNEPAAAATPEKMSEKAPEKTAEKTAETTGKKPAVTPDTNASDNRDVLAKINEALSTPSQAEAEKPQPEAPKATPVVPAAPEAAPAKPESLISAEAAAAATAQFRRLQSNAEVAEDVHVPSPPFRSGTTVEDLVTEMLRPMMKEWLDTNLPQIVERIVEREVAKLTR